MMDWIMGGYSSIKAATDITQSMLTLKTDAAVTTKVIELNGVLLGLQGQLNTAHVEQTTLTGRIRDLETEVAQFKRWEQEKERYSLHEFPLGTLAYRVKTEMQGSEPLHYICANCYQKGVKSLLQSCEDGWFKALRCNHCSSIIHIENIPTVGVASTNYDPYNGF